jgi:hypothetical protein
MVQNPEIPTSLAFDQNENTRTQLPEKVLERGFKLETRENFAFSVLMIMSFYAALEGPSIGVALPVSIPSRTTQF